MNRIRVMVIDDERSAREELKGMLSGISDFHLAGEAANADQAEEMIHRLIPDLIFLDIQMPGRSGFELLESLQVLPEVIFVTAYDRYAVEAFEVGAMDYLMKPVRAERFERALSLARERILRGIGSKVFIQDGKTVHLFSWQEVWLIESMDNYARIHYRDRQVLYKVSLNQLEEKLGAGFFRANRAQLINLDELDRANTGLSLVTTFYMKNGTRVILSGRQSARFRAMARK
jgi:two-component system LytT family response regulator